MSDFFEQVKMSMNDVKTADLKAKYAGSAKEQIMNTIFDKFDAFDRFKRFPNDVDAATIDSFKKDGKIDIGTFNYVYNIRHYLYEEGNLSEEKVKNLFGENINIEDVQVALDDMVAQAKVEREKAVEEIGRQMEANQQKVKAANPNIPNGVLENLGPDDKVKVVTKNGQDFYQVYEDDENEYYEYNGQGNLVRRVGHVGIGGSNGIEHSAKEIELFDENNRSYGEIYEYDNGFVEMRDYKNKRVAKQFGKTRYDYSLDNDYNEHLESITLNEGLPNATKMKFKFDENGKIKDIEFNAEDDKKPKMLGEYKDTTIKQPPVKMTAKEKQELIDFLNSGAILGDDFELKFNGTKIDIIPVIKDKNGKYLDNIPSNLKQEVIGLMKQGFHAGLDYDPSVDDNGDYRLDFQSQQSKEYEGDEKIVKYSRDGKTKTTLTTDGNEVKTTTTTKDGHSSTYVSNRGDELLMKLLDGNYKEANDLLGDIDYEVNNFDFFAVCDKYQQMTGKNLMQEVIKEYKEGKIPNTMIKRLAPTVGWGYYDKQYSNNYLKLPFIQNLAQEEYDRGIKLFKEILNFDPKTSQVADMLPTIGPKENISANKYSQKIGNKTYTVEKHDNAISVSCNGQTHTIDLSNIHKNIQKQIMDVNPAVLYRIAEKGTKLELVNDNKATQNGGYSPENLIVMNVGRMSTSYFKRTLAHETGHSYYNKEETPTNPAFEASFKEEFEAWQKFEDEFKEGNHAYAAESSTEFFAEAYCLLVTGESKSAYTICKFFPKTLAIVKQMLGD